MKINQSDVTFFTYADEKYYPFVLPYVYSILINTNAKIEIALENENSFFNKYGKKISNICYKMDPLVKRFALYFSAKHNKVIPNTKRFVYEPCEQTKYTYITDVDMIITSKMFEKALENNAEGMKRNKTSFFNIVRDSGPKLSGVHFVETKKWYPKVAQYLKKFEGISDINQFGDEARLYKIVKECFGDPEKLTEGNERILPGYHLSPNRGKKYTDIKEELCKDEGWKYAFTQFSPDFLKLF
jgi:hypothetical protein